MNNIQVIKKILSKQNKGVKLLGDATSILKNSEHLPIKHEFADQIYLRQMRLI